MRGTAGIPKGVLSSRSTLLVEVLGGTYRVLVERPGLKAKVLGRESLTSAGESIRITLTASHLFDFRTLVHCSHNQWDIFKLDPNYECLVKKYPGLTMVRYIEPEAHSIGQVHIGKRPHDDIYNTRYADSGSGGDVSMEDDMSSECRASWDDSDGPARKRPNLRATSPPRWNERGLRAKKRERDEHKQKQRLDELQARARARDERNLRDAMEDLPPSQAYGAQSALVYLRRAEYLWIIRR
jgi:hypothetical protein